jgi:hypothetical protein
MQRFRVQLQIQKENEKRAQAEHEAKIKALEGKVNIDVSFDFTDADSTIGVIRQLWRSTDSIPRKWRHHNSRKWCEEPLG